LVICHIESSASQHSLILSFLPFRCSGLDFGPFGTPNGHQNRHCNDKIKSTR
jgi:hypothetical protein